jgi:WD40 repeat protein
MATNTTINGQNSSMDGERIERVLPELPASLLVGHIFPFLDRRTQLNFSLLCKELYAESRHQNLVWPAGHFLEGLTCSKVLSMEFSPDKSTLALGCSDGNVRLWHSRYSRRQKLKEGCTSPVLSVAYSPDQSMFASASQDGAIRLFDTRDNYSLDRILGGGDCTRFQWILFSPDSRMLASSSWDEQVRLWRVSDGECILTLPGQLHGTNSIAFSPDSKTLATVRADGDVQFWNILNDTSRTLFDHRHRHIHVRNLVFAPNGQQIATTAADDNYKIRLWNLSDGVCVKTFQGHSCSIESLAFSGDGNKMVSGSCDHRNSIRVWNVQDESCTFAAKGYTFGVMSLALSADGQALAANLDQSCCIWNV